MERVGGKEKEEGEGKRGERERRREGREREGERGEREERGKEGREGEGKRGGREREGESERGEGEGQRGVWHAWHVNCTQEQNSPATRSHCYRHQVYAVFSALICSCV